MPPYTFAPASLRSVRALIEMALAEDIGTGDITTAATIPADVMAQAVLVAKDDGILAGLPIVAEVLSAVDGALRLDPLLADGVPVSRGTRLAEIAGPAHSLLTAERTALNFLQRLSGIATTTARYVAAVSGTPARIVDTRKTVPGHRVLDKYAVRMGGGYNHRFSLADGVLIKDNHIAALGGVAEAVRAARAQAPHTLKIEVEITDRHMLQQAQQAGADIILLDNMSPAEMRACVELLAGSALTEASGNITLENVRAVAECGVDFISIGALTHSVKALDISLQFEL